MVWPYAGASLTALNSLAAGVRLQRVYVCVRVRVCESPLYDMSGFNTLCCVYTRPIIAHKKFGGINHVTVHAL